MLFDTNHFSSKKITETQPDPAWDDGEAFPIDSKNLKVGSRNEVELCDNLIYAQESAQGFASQDCSLDLTSLELQKQTNTAQTSLENDIQESTTTGTCSPSPNLEAGDSDEEASTLSNWLLATAIGLYISDFVSLFFIYILGRKTLVAGFIGGIAGLFTEIFIQLLTAFLGFFFFGIVFRQNVAVGRISPLVVIFKSIGGFIGWLLGEVICNGLQIGLQPLLGNSTFAFIFMGSLLSGLIFGLILATFQWSVLRVIFRDIGINAKFNLWICTTIAGFILYVFFLQITVSIILTNRGIFPIIIAYSLASVELGFLLTFGQWFFFRQYFSRSIKWILSGIRGGFLGAFVGSLLFIVKMLTI